MENPKALTVWEESLVPCSCRTDMAEHHAKGLMVRVAEISVKTYNHTRSLALREGHGCGRSETPRHEIRMFG